MKRTIVEIRNGDNRKQYLFRGDVSVIVGTSHIRVLEMENIAKETILPYEPSEAILVRNWGNLNV